MYICCCLCDTFAVHLYCLYFWNWSIILTSEPWYPPINFTFYHILHATYPHQAEISTSQSHLHSASHTLLTSTSYEYSSTMYKPHEHHHQYCSHTPSCPPPPPPAGTIPPPKELQWCSNEMQVIKFEISQQLMLQFEWIKVSSQSTIWGGFYGVVYRISSVHGSPLRGLSLNLSIFNFLNNFFHGIWSKPSERAFSSE